MQFATEFLAPPVDIEAALDINSLIDPAVMFAIEDGVTDEALRIDHDGALDSELVDPGLILLAGQDLRTTETDGEDFHIGHPFGDSVL